MPHEIIIYANSLYEHSEFRPQILTHLEKPQVIDTRIQMIPLRWKHVGAETLLILRSIGKMLGCGTE